MLKRIMGLISTTTITLFLQNLFVSHIVFEMLLQLFVKFLRLTDKTEQKLDYQR